MITPSNPTGDDHDEPTEDLRPRADRQRRNRSRPRPRRDGARFGRQRQPHCSRSDQSLLPGSAFAAGLPQPCQSSQEVRTRTMSNIDMNMIELTDADLEMVSAAGSDGASVGAVIGFAVGCVYGGIVGGATGAEVGAGIGAIQGGSVGSHLEDKVVHK